jgi:hypothetical protein
MKTPVAVIVSLALHGAMLLVAAAIGAWVIGDVAEAASEAAGTAVHTEGGFHGDSVEVEGLLEGEGDALEQRAPEPAPAAKPEPAPVVTENPAPVAKEDTPASADGEDKRVEKPRPHKRKHRGRARKGGSPPPGGGSSQASTGKPPTKYGAPTTEAGVLRIITAFAQATPRAVSGDPVWLDLPLGEGGEVTVTLTLDAGQIVKSDYPPETPRHLSIIIDKALLVLGRRSYALSLKDGDSGQEQLRVSVVLSQREVKKKKQPKDERTVLHLAYDEAHENTPARAYFTLASGRHVEITIDAI